MEPVTVVFSRTVRSGREAEFEQFAHEAATLASKYPGHLGGTVLRQPGSRDYHIVYRFRDQESFEAWMGSRERHGWLSKIEPVIE